MFPLLTWNRLHPSNDSGAFSHDQMEFLLARTSFQFRYYQVCVLSPKRATDFPHAGFTFLFGIRLPFESKTLAYFIHFENENSIWLHHTNLYIIKLDFSDFDGVPQTHMQRDTSWAAVHRQFRARLFSISESNLKSRGTFVYIIWRRTVFLKPNCAKRTNAPTFCTWKVFLSEFCTIVSINSTVAVVNSSVWKFRAGFVRLSQSRPIQIGEKRL